MRYPWLVLNTWAPFRIDALGLVTLLGAEEVDTCIGRLVASRWLEYLPLLGAYVIAGDQIKDRMPSFHLYNVSGGMYTPELSSWLTRWTLVQDFQNVRSVVYWEYVKDGRTWWHYRLFSAALSFAFMGFLVAMAVMSRDWYGFANAIAMIVSIVVRTYVLDANRAAVDSAVKENINEPLPGTYLHALKLYNEKGRSKGAKKPNKDKNAKGQPWRKQEFQLAKTLVVMSDAKVVTMYIPEPLIRDVFVRNVEPEPDWLYQLFRWIGWLAFAVHIIAIGMSTLAVQMYTVALIVIPTVLITYKFGCDDSKLWRRWHERKKEYDDPLAEALPYTCWIGSHLRATVFEWPKDVDFEKNNDKDWELELEWPGASDAPANNRSGWDFGRPSDLKEKPQRRQDLYAWLRLTHHEESSLVTWDFFPHERPSSGAWNSDYQEKKSLIEGREEFRVEIFRREAFKKTTEGRNPAPKRGYGDPDPEKGKAGLH